MKGDFSRITFEPAKQFSRVLMQQGRVQLDADWNEHASLLLHQIRTLARAIIGPYGGWSQTAFHIAKQNPTTLAVGVGGYFVDGMLCWSDGTLALVAPKEWTSNKDSALHPVNGEYLVFLAAGERLITFIDDDDIREKALGEGVDTTARTKVVAAVSAIKVDGLSAAGGDDRIKLVEATLDSLRPPPGLTTMAASVESQAKPDDICSVPPSAQFRGSANRLYRVEIHTPSKAGKGATFKWSRENASVAFPVTENAQGNRISIRRYSRDRFAIEKGDWVEFEDEDLIAAGVSSELAHVESVDADGITVDKVPFPDFGGDSNKHPVLRRWDHSPLPAAPTYYHRGTIAIEHEDRTYPLEQGIQVQFHALGHEYARGDYWVIPARTLTGGIDWPSKPKRYVPAHRAESGWAPLAVITVTDGKIDDNPTDLRSLIKPLAVPVP
jgi:hypothetical protein